MHEFISTIFYTFMRAIPLALVALVIGVIILVMVTLKYRREGRKFPKSQAVALILLLCYLGGLIAITFMNRFDGVRMGVQLYPLLAFWEAWNSFTLQVWLNPLLNIAMFIPFGVLLPLAVKTFRRWYWMFVAGTGTSLVIEIVQYILGRGQADVDDLICNTLGAMLGYCLYGLVISLVRRRWKLAIAHALLPLLSGATLAGVFLVYQLQPYGNLADAPIYHEIFDEALAAYNAKKKKTRDKIPDYYEHIRQGKQEKLFHEAIFQIGNLEDCGCGSPGGERAAAALKEFAESFQERNPHLRVFNMVLHMDEATPHLHVDFVPVATEQSRGLSTRVSMKQALKQQGFVGLGRNQTEWRAWMEREKASLTEIAQAHEFEIISLGGGRPHMELPEFKAAAKRLEAVQEQVAAAEQDIAELEQQRKALQGTVRQLQAAEKVRVDLDAIQPEKTLTGAVKGVTVEQVKELKAAAIRGAAAEQKVKELKVENQQLHSRIPSMKEKLKEAEERQRLINENRNLQVQVEYLENSLDSERNFTSRLLEGVEAVLDFLDRHLPEQFRPMLERARELLPVPELQQPEQEQDRGHTWGGMEL